MQLTRGHYLALLSVGVGNATEQEVVLLVAAYAQAERAFAERIEAPVATLRDWEQGRFAPPGGVLCLLRLIIKHPELSQELSVA